MMVYALSGITLIFRKTDSFKVSVHKEITVEPGLDAPALGEALRIRNLLPTDNDGTVMVFEQGRYNTVTGEADYTVKELPYWLDKLTHLHKATTCNQYCIIRIRTKRCITIRSNRRCFRGGH